MPGIYVPDRVVEKYKEMHQEKNMRKLLLKFQRKSLKWERG